MAIAGTIHQTASGTQHLHAGQKVDFMNLTIFQDGRCAHESTRAF